MRNFVSVVFDSSAKAYDGLHELWNLDREGDVRCTEQRSCTVTALAGSWSIRSDGPRPSRQPSEPALARSWGP